MQAPTQNKSHIAVQIGPHYEGNGKWHINGQAQVTKDAAAEQLDELKLLTKGQLDLEWSLVVCLTTAAGKAGDLENAIKLAAEQNELEDVVLKSFSTENQVFLSVKGNPEMEADFMEPFNMVFAQGLDNVAQNQSNTVNFQLSSNQDLQTAGQLLNDKERIVAVLLKSAKALLKVDLNSELLGVLKQIFANFDPEFAEEPGWNFFSKFKNFKIDLDFKSSDELPEFVRKNHFQSKKFQNLVDEYQGQNILDEIPGVNGIVENFGPTFQVWFTIPDFVAVQADGSFPGLSQLIKDYGKATSEFI